ncbi:MAG TPA: phytanoyl-CoA dioxygenase family protein [Nannocystis sp.]|jgi:hypothetical protein
MEPAQIDLFREQGWLRLAGFYSCRRMAPIKQVVLDALKRSKIWATGKSLSRRLQDLPVFQQNGQLASLVAVPGLHDACITRELIAVMTELAGRLPTSSQAARLLLSLPHQGTWTLQGLNWHVDMAVKPGELAHGVQSFILIDDVAPRGGATLALAGSHRAVLRGGTTASRLREALKTSPDLAASLRDMGLAVIEMSGRAGDIFLMDMRLLHTPSINATKNLRMMATARYFFDHPTSLPGPRT